MKKSIRELKELRGEALRAMTALVEQRGESMDEKSLAAVKSFKDDITNFDAQIEAIESVRSLASKMSQPAAVVLTEKRAAHNAAFADYLRGSKTEKEVRAVGAGDATAGKETVPDDFLNELQEKILEFGVISPDARHITTTNHGTLFVPQIDDTASAGVWTAEHGAITPEDF
ncbi:MAG: phage major capsid protein, partial [Deltaproteobacteria bacterium]